MTISSTITGSLTALALVVGLAPAPASATTIAWTQGDSGDNWSQNVTPEYANTISWSGTTSYYFGYFGGPTAHSHGQTVDWAMTAVVNGVTQTIYTATISGGAESSIDALGTIAFAGGLVTNVGFTCANCSFNTYHQFGDATFTLGNTVPEPAAWALMLTGFGLVGAAARRKGATTVAA